MRITWKHRDRSIEFERQPLPPERFAALCKLAALMVVGTVLLALVHMLDIWGLVLTLAGMALYKLVREDFF